MRRVVVLGLFALALPMAAWANGIDFTNTFGSVSVSTSGITSTGSQLLSFNGITAPKGRSLGSVSFSTGVLASGTISGGGTFSAMNSSFVVKGVGSYGQPQGTIFSGSFVGPITWTLVSKVGQDVTYTLSGTVSGTWMGGRSVTAHVTETLYSTTAQLGKGIGHIRLGSTQLSVPEPGTLGLLGTGLVAIAGMFRRKLLGS